MQSEGCPCRDLRRFSLTRPSRETTLCSVPSPCCAHIITILPSLRVTFLYLPLFSPRTKTRCVLWHAVKASGEMSEHEWTGRNLLISAALIAAARGRRSWVHRDASLVGDFQFLRQRPFMRFRDAYLTEQRHSRTLEDTRWSSIHQACKVACSGSYSFFKGMICRSSERASASCFTLQI